MFSALRHYLQNSSVVNQRITEEAKSLLQYFHDHHGAALDPGNIFVTATANISATFVFGKAFTLTSDFRQFLELKDETLKPGNYRLILFVLDLFPAFIRFFSAFEYHKTNCSQLYGIVRRQLKHREKIFNPMEPINDLIGGLLKAREETKNESPEHSKFLVDGNMLGSLEDMFTAGYETTSTTLSWAFAFLLNYPQIQAEIQKQIDEVVGENRLPQLEDSPNLPLVNAFIRETLRVGNTADATLPHYTLQDTTLCGYRIPKDTMVIVDLGAVHMDSQGWDNPREFNPHRHLDANGSVVAKQDHFLAFSAGRRVCVGEPLAKLELFLFLSIMLHQYSFIPAEGEPLPDLVGVRGLIIKPKPYKMSAIKRR